jgi:uroporphyrin-III C-methyltransferase/precorrin-2 dehydrogenase/sirohydrochlorin ferrochelatase
VYLVGAGPGDPDLLTLKALRLMQQAEVVLYDRLVPEPILDQVRKDAERVFVGKRGADHDGRQGQINELLVEYASAGKRVLRLKGGDPFLFGRGFQEIEPLVDAGIPFQVVPGITAANGCAACAGIPLTHRDLAPTVVLLTAHRVDGVFQMDSDVVTRPRQTVVFYMAGADLGPLCNWLTEHGLPEGTPAAIVERGTRPDQRVIRSTIGDMAAGSTGPCDSPSLLIVGDVVALARISP